MLFQPNDTTTVITVVMARIHTLSEAALTSPDQVRDTGHITGLRVQRLRPAALQYPGESEEPAEMPPQQAPLPLGKSPLNSRLSRCHLSLSTQVSGSS